MCGFYRYLVLAARFTPRQHFGSAISLRNNSSTLCSLHSKGCPTGKRAVVHTTSYAELLLPESGFNIKAKSFDKQEAPGWAARNGDETVVWLLVEKGADEREAGTAYGG